MTDTITTHRTPDAHERAEVACPDCGHAMHAGVSSMTYFDEAGYYSPAPKVVTTWRCGACGRSLQLWEVCGGK